MLKTWINGIYSEQVSCVQTKPVEYFNVQETVIATVDNDEWGNSRGKVNVDNH